MQNLNKKYIIVCFTYILSSLGIQPMTLALVATHTTKRGTKTSLFLSKLLVFPEAVTSIKPKY